MVLIFAPLLPARSNFVCAEKTVCYGDKIFAWCGFPSSMKKKKYETRGKSWKSFSTPSQPPSPSGNAELRAKVQVWHQEFRLFGVFYCCPRSLSDRSKLEELVNYRRRRRRCGYHQSKFNKPFTATIAGSWESDPLRKSRHFNNLSYFPKVCRH